MAQRIWHAVVALLVFAGGLGAISCAVSQSPQPMPLATVSPPAAVRSPADFPLAKGTTWVYSYVPYQPTLADPSQIITATYVITETVVETQAAVPYFLAHVRREEHLLAAQPGWVEEESGQPQDVWYVALGQQVFESNEPLDPARIQTDTLALAYDLPLAVGKAWCPFRVDLKDPEHSPVTNCDAAGKRIVRNEGPYETPAGRFDDCFEIGEFWNSGGVTRWFRNGIGVVAAQYDHAGTRFGFRQVLVSYVKGTP